MTIRSVALLVGVMMLAGPATVRADHRLFQPSVRALAAADQDDPPPREEPPGVKKQAATPVTPVEETPYYKTWWFWALTAAVVGGTVVLGVATFEPMEHHPMACPAGTVVCFGDRPAR